MNRRKLWIGWAFNGALSLISYCLGLESIAIAEMAVCAVLGWMAVATPKSKIGEE